MEYIKVLCCEEQTGKFSLISTLLEKLKEALKINVTNASGKCYADYILEEVDEENEEYQEPFELTCEFIYQSKPHKMDIKRISRKGRKFICLKAENEIDEDIAMLESSGWYEFKEKLLEVLSENYEQIFWLADSQNMKIARKLYGELHILENYLREIINSYMAIKYGGDWFEKYSYEQHLNKYKKFYEWFSRSRYNLFKKVDNHLYNLEIDDIFDVLKVARKKQITGTTKKALESIRDREGDKALEIANTGLLDSPSLWDEEKFDEIFSKKVVGRWKADLAKRRNMVAHNKLICRKMYDDTIAEIRYFKEAFEKAEELLNDRIQSDEMVKVKSLQREDEDALNLEYCGIDPDLPDEQDIVDRLNEQDDLIRLSGIMEDDIEKLRRSIEDTLFYFKDIRETLNRDRFFEDHKLVRKDLLDKYIELGEGHPLCLTWKSLLKENITEDIYLLIEAALKEHLLSVEEKIKNIQDSLYCADLRGFSEGDLVRIHDFEGDEFSVTVSGWFCPDRGCSDEVYVNWIENGIIIERGGIYISYGDYEMTEDGIPMPCVEDELSVNFSEVNDKLEAVVQEILEKLGDIENKYIELEQ